jgi:hypothetical protein
MDPAFAHFSEVYGKCFTQSHDDAGGGRVSLRGAVRGRYFEPEPTRELPS